MLLAKCGIDHILKERRKRHEQITKLKVHYKIYCNESAQVARIMMKEQTHKREPTLILQSVNDVTTEL